MVRRRLFLLVVMLALLLVACAPHNAKQAVGALAAQLPEVAQTSDPTAAPELSDIPSTLAPTDSAVVPNEPPDTCPVTHGPNPPFTPPPPYSQDFTGEFWYGTDDLWTSIPTSGVWSSLPHNPDGYTQKVFWWREGYSWTEEPEPQLSVTGRRLDAPAPPLHVSRATNAFAADIGSAMLVGVDFLTLGCWEITGHYADSELSFVVWAAP